MLKHMRNYVVVLKLVKQMIVIVAPIVLVTLWLIAK